MINSRRLKTAVTDRRYSKSAGVGFCLFVFGLLVLRGESQSPGSKVRTAVAERRYTKRQRAQVFEDQTTHAFHVSYLLFLPADYEKNSEKRWPLILYLHGGSLRGNDVESVRKLGLPEKLEHDPDFPFVVVSPQCPIGEIWTDVEALGALLDRIQVEYRIDADRVYVTGHSMGGRGALYMAYRQPGRFAGVIALSPLSPIIDWKDNLAKLPIWILHGKNDTLAPVADTEELIRGIESAGGRPRVDILPDRDHFILDIYNRPEIYEWLRRQKREIGAMH